MLAILGGSGLTSFAELKLERREVIRTPYGEPSGPLSFGHLHDAPIVFLPRHGYGHTIPPHNINYRANLWALSHIGAKGVIAVAAVGAIRADLHPGAVVLPDQILDYTWGRNSSYFDSTETPVTHIDFTLPFDEALRTRLRAAAKAAGKTLVDGACYACTQGPRLETAAEINRLERDGADLVGMTLMPEASLARELELPYAALAVISNHAAGRGDSRTRISMSDVGRTLETAIADVRALIISLAAQNGGAS